MSTFTIVVIIGIIILLLVIAAYAYITYQKNQSSKIRQAPGTIYATAGYTQLQDQGTTSNNYMPAGGCPGNQAGNNAPDCVLSAANAANVCNTDPNCAGYATSPNYPGSGPSFVLVPQGTTLTSLAGGIAVMKSAGAVAVPA